MEIKATFRTHFVEFTKREWRIVWCSLFAAREILEGDPQDGRTFRREKSKAYGQLEDKFSGSIPKVREIPLTESECEIIYNSVNLVGDLMDEDWFIEDYGEPLHMDFTPEELAEFSRDLWATIWMMGKAG